MADLLTDSERISAEASSYGNFMLQVDNRTWPSGVLVDELVRPLLRISEGVEFPGYKKVWLRDAKAPPKWAQELSSLLDCEILSGADAASDRLREFWVEGSFVERSAGSGPPKVFRPAIPLIHLQPAKIRALPIRAFATTFVGFSIKPQSKRGLLGAAYRKALANSVGDSSRAFLPFQDTSWLCFVGSNVVLSECIDALGDSFA